VCGLEWLAEHLCAAGFNRISSNIAGGISADREDWCLRQRAPLSNPAGGLDSIHFGKREIHQDQIRNYAVRLDETFLTIPSFNDFESMCPQER